MRSNSEEREDAEEPYVKEQGGSWSILGRYGMDLGSILCRFHVDVEAILGRYWSILDRSQVDLGSSGRDPRSTC